MASQFEKDLYSAFQAIPPGDSLTVIDLNSFTHFEWDSVFILKGDDSAPIDPSHIVQHLHRPTEELPIDSDRFYFIKEGEVIATYTIDTVSAAWRDHVWWVLPCPDRSITNNYTFEYHWFSKEECRFRAEKGQWKYGHYALFLHPNCLNEANDL